jgi:imidazole glycerol phosphate synthase glutamine amidotransferase subunit
VIGVLDLGGGNLASVGYALDRLETAWTLVRTPSQLDAVDALIFPGVGAAGAAMAGLRTSGLLPALQAFLRSGRPYLGICLGLQLLFDRSAEDGQPCLGVIPGRVVRLATWEKVPHTGWNTVESTRWSALLEGVDGEAFYFTHSYVAEPLSGEVACARTTHGVSFVSAVTAGPLAGVQFHPERSGTAGLRLLRNFAGLSAPGFDAG